MCGFEREVLIDKTRAMQYVSMCRVANSAFQTVITAMWIIPVSSVLYIYLTKTKTVNVHYFEMSTFRIVGLQRTVSITCTT